MKLKLLPRSPALFTGRKDILKKLEEFFHETGLFYIEGITGTGKTSLMLKWANILAAQDKYRNKILWIKCEEDCTLEHLLIDIHDWPVMKDKDSFHEKKEEKIEDRLTYIINSLNRNKCILFIDDFQNIKRKSAENFILTLNNYLADGRVYLISRTPPPLQPFEQIDLFKIRIQNLNERESIDFIINLLNFHHCTEVPEEKILENIIEQSQGHPLLIKTLAGILISKTSNSEEITKWSNNVKEDITHLMFSKAVENLDIQDRKTLEILSPFRIPVPLETVMETGRGEISKENLLALEDKILVEKDELSQYILQPLLKDYIWNRFDDNKKISLHKACALYFEEVMKKTGSEEAYLLREAFYHNIKAKEADKAGNLLQTFMSKLCSMGLYEELIDKLEILKEHTSLNPEMKIMKANALSILGRWEESLVILEEVRNEIDDKKTVAEVYSSLAGSYLNRGNFKKSLHLYEEVLKIFRDLNDTSRITKVANYLAFIYSFRGELIEATKFQEESFKLAKKEENIIGIAHSLRAKGMILLEQNNFSEALKTAEECFEIARSTGSSRICAWALDIKGKALLNLYRYEEAEEVFLHNLEMAEETGDTLIIAFSYLGLGRICYETGDLEKGTDLFKKSIKNYESQGNYLGSATGKYYLGLIEEEKDNLFEAFNLYSETMETAKEMGFPGLEIKAGIKIIENALKRGERDLALGGINQIKEKAGRGDLEKENINLHLLLGEIHFRKNKEGETKQVLKEALKIAEKSQNICGIAKAAFFMSKILKKDAKERNLMENRAGENLLKLRGSLKREAENFFKKTDKIFEEKFLLKTRDREIIAGLSEAEEARHKKDDFEFWLDIPGKEAFVKEKGEIDVFKKRTVLSLLLLFLRNAGRGFSPEEIYKEIWGWEYDEAVSGTEIRKNISRLRKLIEPDRDNLKYILLKEAFLGEKGKYYFNNEINFCLIDEIKTKE